MILVLADQGCGIGKRNESVVFSHTLKKIKKINHTYVFGKCDAIPDEVALLVGISKTQAKQICLNFDVRYNIHMLLQREGKKHI